MTGGAVHGAAHRQLALVAEHRAHLRGFADQADGRFVRPGGQLGEQAAHAETADLFVVGNGDMHGQAQRLGK